MIARLATLALLFAGCGEVHAPALPPDGGPTGPDAMLACTGETVAELCAAKAAACGALDATDRCSEVRHLDCGQCTTAGETCGGGGVANHCDAHPELKAVDGYILGTGRYAIHFALNGVPNNGGFCCEDTIEATRAAYPQYNLIVLPEQSQIPADAIPSLYRVDGYLVKHPQDPSMFEYRGAVNGKMDGTSDCCAASVAAARAARPTKNLAYLPFFGVDGP